MLDRDVARSQHDLQLGDIIQRRGPTRRPTGITTRRPRRCRDLGVREHRWHPLGNRVQPARQTRPLDIQPALHPRNVRERLTHRLTRRRTNIQQLEPTNNLDNTPRHVNRQRKSRFNTMRKTEACDRSGKTRPSTWTNTCKGYPVECSDHDMLCSWYATRRPVGRLGRGRARSPESTIQGRGRRSSRGSVMTMRAVRTLSGCGGRTGSGVRPARRRRRGGRGPGCGCVRRVSARFR